MAAESAKEFEALEAQATTLLDTFRRAGYEQVAPSIIQPADVFLDQIGEQVRSRTYVFTDLAGDELCLRPDLTVPVSRLYLERHPEADTRARYCYNGPAFRSPPPGGLAGSCSTFFSAPRPPSMRCSPVSREASGRTATARSWRSPAGLPAYL